ncbi:predicted protein [Plenodomus lingam JN3]|uniref:Predicted protein n=1 Tax=Leptosphaeria maculans (strain JN3 / isolate v23.1.3 / race Av1-4-5-6-7-8) TaxID=985895 RepID=E4ZY47_LEPMJ|nr:predicted protein [Plenodomus lingam JN3]CBX96292.1 predicted protein [Plenodomus lingam JN3]
MAIPVALAVISLLYDSLPSRVRELCTARANASIIPRHATADALLESIIPN